MKKILLFFLMFLLSTYSFSAAYTVSVYAGSQVFIDTADDYACGSWGAGGRVDFCPNDTGFYTGFDILFLPSYYDEIEPGWADFALSLKIPLGFRWPGKYRDTGHYRTMGFYLGAGPELLLLTAPGEFTSFYANLFLDMGFQTNKTKGVGFHIGFHLSICPYKWGESYYLPIPSIGYGIQIGISWRRLRH